MWRIIEIIKLFQNSEKLISLKFLIKKYGVTIRTLQSDITIINKLFSKNSDNQIVIVKQNLYLIGRNKQKSIRFLLSSLLNSAKTDKWEKFKPIILNQFWEQEYLPKFKLENYNQSFHEFKITLQSINKYLNCLSIKIQFLKKKKTAWILNGAEKDLRFLITLILIENNHLPPYPNQVLDPTLTSLYLHIKKILQFQDFSNYNIEHLIWYLVVFVRRNKKLKFNIKEIVFHPQLYVNHKLEENLELLIVQIEKNFNFQIKPLEIDYLRLSLILNQKIQNLDLKNCLISKIIEVVIKQIFTIYNLPFIKSKFILILNQFFSNYWNYLLFNFIPFLKLGQNFDYFSLNHNAYLLNDVINIINLVLKKNNINSLWNNLLAEQLNFAIKQNKFSNTQKNWIISFYIVKSKNKNFDFKFDCIKQFLHNKYSNVKIKCLNFHFSLPFMLNFINKTNNILIFDVFKFSKSEYKNIVTVQSENLTLNDQFEELIESAFNLSNLQIICNSISIYKFFYNHYFSNLKEILWIVADTVKRKFKINCESFTLKNAALNETYCHNNIIILHKIIPFENLELPILLIYLENPVSYKASFKTKQSINFIFIVINSTNNLFRYNWIILFIQNYQWNELRNIKNAETLYQTLYFP